MLILMVKQCWKLIFPGIVLLNGAVDGIFTIDLPAFLGVICHSWYFHRHKAALKIINNEKLDSK